MSSGSDRTDELIQDLSPHTAWQAWNLVRDARAAGVPLVVISGRRSYERNQDVGGASRSLHLAGRAFDVAVWGFTRDQIPGWWWELLGAYAEHRYGLFWGGRFLHAGAADVNHFDSRLQTSV